MHDDNYKYYKFSGKWCIHLHLGPHILLSMIQFLKDRWLLLTVVVAFIIVKIPVLHLPFFWDESWSYAPGVKLMYMHGPSLMPNAIDLFYSRGHPLLFYASAATWMHIFGDSHTSQHVFALFISISLLISIYEVTLSLFSKRVAILSLLLSATQVIFFVQSTLLLPEVMISWLALLSLYFYASGRYLFTALTCTALMLTKESGMVLGLVLGVHGIIYLFSRSASVASKIRNLLSVLIPGIIIVIFFLVQKKFNGWYLFPEHTSLIDWSWDTFKGKVHFCFEIIFHNQFRYLLYSLLVIASAIAAIYYRNLRYALPLFFSVLLYVFIGDYFGYISRKVFIPVLFASFIFACYTLIRLDKDGKPQTRKFIYLTISFLLAYITFSSLNFFTVRYLLCPVLLFVVLAAYCFDLYLRPLKSAGYLTLIGCILLIAGISFSDSTGKGDVDLNVYSAMQAEQDIVTYLEQHNHYDSHIATNSGLECTHLTQPYTGFLSSDKIFSDVQGDIKPNTELIIVDNIDADTVLLNTPGFKPLYRSQHGIIWAEIRSKSQ